MAYILSDISALFRSDTYITVRDYQDGSLVYHGLNDSGLDNINHLEIVGEVEATFEGAVYVQVEND